MKPSKSFNQRQQYKRENNALFQKKAETAIGKLVDSADEP
jgi:hypothetical protein